MKKKQYAIYLCDNEIFFFNNMKKESVIKQKFQSLKGEQIIDSSLFINELNQFIKSNRIKISLFGDNLYFIKNETINNVVLEKYEEVLKEYFCKINYIDLIQILKIDKDNGFLLITKDYFDYYFMKNNESCLIRISLKIFNNHLKKAIHHVIANIYKPKKLMVLGNQENTSKIAEDINHEYNILTTFPEKHYQYIFEEYKK